MFGIGKRRVTDDDAPEHVQSAGDRADHIVTTHWESPNLADYAPSAASIPQRVLRRRAQEDAKVGRPDVKEAEFSGAQDEIETKVRADQDAYASDLRNRINAVRNVLGTLDHDRLDPLGRDGEHLLLDTKLATMNSDADTHWRENQDTFADVDNDEMTLARDLRFFKSEHKRTAPAEYPDSQRMFWATVLLALAFEGFVNGLVFQRVMDGFIAAVGMAVLFGAINVAAGFAFGWVGWRNIIHKSSKRKVIGWLSSAAILAFGIFWNLFVAHFREVAESGDDAALANVGGHLAADPLGIRSAEGLALLAIGTLIFFYVAWKGYRKLDDPYIDYGKKTRGYRAVADELNDYKGEIRDSIADSAERTRGELRAQAERAKGDALGAEMLVDYLVKHNADLDRSMSKSVAMANQRLGDYREANMGIRGGRAPASFSRTLSAHDYPLEYDDDIKELQNTRKAIADAVAHNAPILQAIINRITAHEAELQAKADERFARVREENENKEVNVAGTEDAKGAVPVQTGFGGPVDDTGLVAG